MIPQAQLMEYFVEVADTMVGDFDIVEFLHDLTVKAAAASGAAAVGLVLIDHHDRVRYMASSNHEGKLLELFQIQNAEGPCLDAMRTGLPVVNADLGEASGRWPIFAPAARAAGFQSVHAFPMQLRDQTIGALNIFGANDARFDPDDVRVVQALADVATIAILHERSNHQTDLITGQLEVALQSRIIVEQAKGALARSQSITPDHAFEVLRSTARSTQQKLADVARSTIADLEAPIAHAITAASVDTPPRAVASPVTTTTLERPTAPAMAGRSVLPFVWPYWDDGETIKPCRECSQWTVELFKLPDTGAVRVREWHDDECPVWERVIEESSDRA